MSHLLGSLFESAVSVCQGPGVKAHLSQTWVGLLFEEERVGFNGHYLLPVSSFIFLQTSLVCPVLESMTVVPGKQLQVTVLAFSCFVTTRCSMTSALAGGSWLRTSGGAGAAATGCFFAAQPVKSRQTTRQPFIMPIVFALYRGLVDGNLDYTAANLSRCQAWRTGQRLFPGPRILVPFPQPAFVRPYSRTRGHRRLRLFLLPIRLG